MNEFIKELCSLDMDYSNFQQTFSPLFSNYGLEFSGETLGVEKLWLHYNRSTSHIFSKLCFFDEKPVELCKTPALIKGIGKNVEFGAAFYDTDSFIISSKGNLPLICFSEKGKHNCGYWIEESDNDSVFIRGYALNADDRDPDKAVPVIFGLKTLKGRLSLDDGIKVFPDNNALAVAFSMSVLDTDICKIKAALKNAPDNYKKAQEISENWIENCIGDYSPAENTSENVKETLIKAICSLIFNLTKASGNLKGYISAFPNRGQYPTHFTWDTCFQNLAFELMNTDIAKESLLLLAQSLREDGKLPQFICSTWVRPHSAQPALLGWASIRYIKKTNDMDFAKKILPALEKNNNWWLHSRITKYGVIFCPDGLETGQDNSPRFDNGATLAADMNSYLLSQLKITAEIADMLGDKEKSEYWELKAKNLERAIIETLYDKDKNFFFDADAKTGEHIPIVTPCGALPLWAGINIPEEKKKELIENYVLNENIFFGEIPFPSVSYSDGTYEHEEWWRGPTWMPEAWLILETLNKYGYEKEYDKAMIRLYNMLVNDNMLHELFDSNTGEGMGAAEQSWTAAIFIRMNNILAE